jgi:hypothetical protein
VNQPQSFQPTIAQIEAILGKEAVARLKAVATGTAIFEKTSANRDVHHAINVLKNADSTDPYLGAELVGVIVNANPREFDDTPEAAVFQAERLITAFNISSKMPLARSVIDPN